MHAFAWLGAALLALWGVLWAGLSMRWSGVHLLVILGVVLLLVGVLRRSADGFHGDD